MKKNIKARTPKRPDKFNNLTDALVYLKKSVYLIARGRTVQTGDDVSINWTTLGTGFLAAPFRLVTAAHVINDPNKPDQHHIDGDKYYLIKHDDSGNYHYRIFEPKLDTDIHLYPEIDLGIIYLDKEFYGNAAQKFADENDFIRISKDFYPIGSEIAVLGYPLCQLTFQDRDLTKPQIGNVLLRVDRGVINSRYRINESVTRYEFTLSFNPGNSGGPIFDVKTGKLISIVHGFRTNTIQTEEVVLNDETRSQLKIQNYTVPSYIKTFSSYYSIGYTTQSFVEAFKAHNITN
jgi:hypothetical protein